MQQLMSSGKQNQATADKPLTASGFLKDFFEQSTHKVWSNSNTGAAGAEIIKKMGQST